MPCQRESPPSGPVSTSALALPVSATSAPPAVGGGWLGGRGGCSHEESSCGGGMRGARSGTCRRAMAVGVAAATGVGSGAPGTMEAAAGIGGMALRGGWPRVLQILRLLREQGLVLAALLGLCAFFSMAETSITRFGLGRLGKELDQLALSRSVASVSSHRWPRLQFAWEGEEKGLVGLHRLFQFTNGMDTTLMAAGA